MFQHFQPTTDQFQFFQLERVMYNRLVKFLDLHSIIFKTVWSLKELFNGLSPDWFNLYHIISCWQKWNNLRCRFWTSLRRLIPLIMKYCMKNCITMVFKTLLWIGTKGILKTELSSSSLAPLDPTTGKSHAVFLRVQFLGLSCSLCMSTTYQLSLTWLNLYYLPMILAFFVLTKDPNQLISIITNELTQILIWLKANKLSLNLSKTNFVFPSKAKENFKC